VVIPVLIDDSAAVPVTLHSPIEPPSPQRPPQQLPSISVTKPPAPLPVELPTARDIVALPSPPDSHSSFDDDLETGNDRQSMRETQNVAAPRRSPITLSNGDNTVGSKSLTSPITSSTAERFVPPPIAEVDLLGSEANNNEATPVMQPSVLSPHSPSSDKASTPSQEAENELDPDVTIRLVGGGGQSGLVDASEEEENDAAPEGQDTEHTVSSETETTAEGKKHKKTKSGLAGLKKLGNLGRKKEDSVGSLKDVTNELSS
jgi:hypothetical protein